jgi:hypothetical protein
VNGFAGFQCLFKIVLEGRTDALGKFVPQVVVKQRCAAPENMRSAARDDIGEAPFNVKVTFPSLMVSSGQ